MFGATTVISVKKLEKSFSYRHSSPGVWGALKGVLSPTHSLMQAVDDLNFTVNSGERIAFIGPNGAGKSTTIKMLTGILYPTAGEIEVLGLIPWRQRRQLAYRIGAVFGQRSQLWYHLPAADTFDLLATIYEIDKITYRHRLNELVDLFDIAQLLHIPVRQLSLGQRMRCEIVASQLHAPEIIFLDEPTIGLDINAKLWIRDLLNKLSKEMGRTLFLTSHDTADIEQVCDRVIVLDRGHIVADCPLRELKRRYMRKKIVSAVTEEEAPTLKLPGLKISDNKKFHFSCEVDLSITPIEQLVDQLLSVATVKDLTIEDPSMDEVIRLIYSTRGDGRNSE